MKTSDYFFLLILHVRKIYYFKSKIPLLLYRPIIFLSWIFAGISWASGARLSMQAGRAGVRSQIAPVSAQPNRSNGAAVFNVGCCRTFKQCNIVTCWKCAKKTHQLSFRTLHKINPNFSLIFLLGRFVIEYGSPKQVCIHRLEMSVQSLGDGGPVPRFTRRGTPACHGSSWCLPHSGTRGQTPESYSSIPGL